MSLIKKLTLPNHLYKKLEYIKFHGAEYLYLPFDITSKYAYYDLKVKVNSQGTIMGYQSSGGPGPESFWYLCNSSGYRCDVFHREGSQYVYESYTANVPSGVTTNIKYVYDSSYKYMVTNTADDTIINSLNSNAQHLYGKTTLGYQGFYLGAINGVGTNDTFYYYSNMNVYSFYLDSNAESAQSAQWYAYKNTSFIPVQRISDNVCGLYDTKHKIFYAMSGTEITNNAAGPWLGSFVDDTENPYILDPEALNCYKDGDTFQNSDYYNLTGFITSSSKAIQLMLIPPKSLKNITSITVDKMEFTFRGMGGYVGGSSYIDYASTTGYSVTASVTESNAIVIIITGTSAFSSATNNTPIVAAARANGIQLTFNA